MKCFLVWMLIALVSFSLTPAAAEPGSEARMTTVGEGVALVVNNDLGKAEDEALADAKRNAVEQAVGVFVRSESLGTDYQQISDDILTRSEGYIISWEKIAGSTSIEHLGADSLLHIKVQAKVGLVNMLDDMSDITPIYDAIDRPKIMVLFDESNLGEHPAARPAQ